MYCTCVTVERGKSPERLNMDRCIRQAALLPEGGRVRGERNLRQQFIIIAAASCIYFRYYARVCIPVPVRCEKRPKKRRRKEMKKNKKRRLSLVPWFIIPIFRLLAKRS